MALKLKKFLFPYVKLTLNRYIIYDVYNITHFTLLYSVSIISNYSVDYSSNTYNVITWTKINTLL